MPVSPAWPRLSEIIRTLIEAFGSPAEITHLRALIRAAQPTQDPLADLCAQFQLPGTLLKALDNPAEFIATTGVELVEQVPVRKAVFARWRQGGSIPATEIRWYLRAGYAAATAVAAIVSLLMTALSAAILITDGAVIDETSDGHDAWPSLAGFAALTVVLTILTVVRTRRLLDR